MRKILLLILIFLFSSVYSQSVHDDHKTEMLELKRFVENTLQRDSTKVEAFARALNGKIYRIKSNDISSEFNFQISDVFEFVKKNNKIIYIRKEPVSETGDSAYSYDYFFNDDGRLIGAEKSVSTFGGNDDVFRYKIEYLLSSATDRLETVKEFFADKDWKEIGKKSERFKVLREDGMLLDLMSYLDLITFKDLVGFMKKENLRYYK